MKNQTRNPIRSRGALLLVLLTSTALASTGKPAQGPHSQNSNAKAPTEIGLPGVPTTPSQALGDSSLMAALAKVRYQIAAIRPRATAETQPAYEASNPAQHLRAEFTGAGVQVLPPGAATPAGLRLELVGYGYAGDPQRLPEGKAAVSGNRVEYDRGDLTEWYINDARGLEQGFTLCSPPARSGLELANQKLALVLAVSGGLRPVLSEDGQSVLFKGAEAEPRFRYGHLSAVDATGRALLAQLALRQGQVTIELDDCAAAWPITVDPLLTMETELTASDGKTNDFFGGSVAIDGDIAVVGAVQGGVSNSGAAYVFMRNGTEWTFQQKLTAHDASGFQLFGASVGVSGETIIVGTSGVFVPGAAYVFVRVGATWFQQQKLTVTNTTTLTYFGNAVAISGDTVIVGAFGEDAGAIESGAAYVFVRGGTIWSEQQKLTASDAALIDEFGHSVAISGDTIVVGAFHKDPGGAAYVFERSGTSWSQQQELTASDAKETDEFGSSVAIGGQPGAQTIVVGAPGFAIGNHFGVGAAYVFVGNGSSWSLQAELPDPDATTVDFFGYSVATSGDTLVVGAYGDEGPAPSSGAVYPYVRSGGDWFQQYPKLTASDGTTNDNFGSSVAISGDTVLVGAPRKASLTGAAYVYAPATVTVSCPGPTTLNCGLPTGQVETVTVNVGGASGGPLTVVWNVDGSDVQTTNVPGSGPPTLAAVSLTQNFTPGSHALQVTVSDGTNSAQCGTTITVVVDTQPPVINCPASDVVKNVDPGQCSAVVTFSVTATDSCPVSVTCNPPSGSTFPRGTNVVNCTAMDLAGNTAVCSFNVIVNDNEAPRVTCRAAPNPADNKIAPKDNSANPNDYFQLLSKDNCDSNLQIFIQDSASAFVAGPFATGEIVKLSENSTRAPGSKPSSGNVIASITLTGVGLIYGVDAQGNASVPVPCH